MKNENQLSVEELDSIAREGLDVAMWVIRGNVSPTKEQKKIINRGFRAASAARRLLNAETKAAEKLLKEGKALQAWKIISKRQGTPPECCVEAGDSL